jgi:diaminohydroxyphosphoribosylaminopyrimidine deaminase/5-amino-6-(5-phosphoribosylamino)uracil reductase
MLRNAGIEVVVGVMEREAVALNRYFMTAHGKNRPYIILKWAESEDGFLDHIRNDASEQPVRMSTPLTRLTVHKMRAEVQAIMVGTNTAVLDNPSLTVRYWSGKSPVRALIDLDLRVPGTHHLFDGLQQTMVFTRQTPPEKSENVEYITVEDDKDMLKIIMTRLKERKIHSLLVEGGAKLHKSFIENGLWDEIIVETAPISLKTGVNAALFRHLEGVQLHYKQTIPAYGLQSEKKSYIERFFNNKT